eukprot:GHVT01099108.1.p1 GENE.GHVT01099108.1~~GHVT01099108.1.p1  ORF type:complete len:720 (-),score=61.76 GHVT01099108.1:455-2614(-)
MYSLCFTVLKLRAKCSLVFAAVYTAMMLLCRLALLFRAVKYYFKTTSSYDAKGLSRASGSDFHSTNEDAAAVPDGIEPCQPAVKSSDCNRVMEVSAAKLAATGRSSFFIPFPSSECSSRGPAAGRSLAALLLPYVANGHIAHRRDPGGRRRCSSTSRATAVALDPHFHPVLHPGHNLGHSPLPCSASRKGVGAALSQNAREQQGDTRKITLEETGNSLLNGKFQSGSTARSHRTETREDAQINVTEKKTPGPQFDQSFPLYSGCMPPSTRSACVETGSKDIDDTLGAGRAARDKTVRRTASEPSPEGNNSCIDSLLATPAQMAGDAAALTWGSSNGSTSFVRRGVYCAQGLLFSSLVQELTQRSVADNSPQNKDEEAITPCLVPSVSALSSAIGIGPFTARLCAFMWYVRWRDRAVMNSLRSLPAPPARLAIRDRIVEATSTRPAAQFTTAKEETSNAELLIPELQDHLELGAYAAGFGRGWPNAQGHTAGISIDVHRLNSGGVHNSRGRRAAQYGEGAASSAACPLTECKLTHPRKAQKPAAKTDVGVMIESRSGTLQAFRPCPAIDFSALPSRALAALLSPRAQITTTDHVSIVPSAFSQFASRTHPQISKPNQQRSVTDLCSQSGQHLSTSLLLQSLKRRLGHSAQSHQPNQPDPVEVTMPEDLNLAVPLSSLSSRSRDHTGWKWRNRRDDRPFVLCLSDETDPPRALCRREPTAE